MKEHTLSPDEVAKLIEDGVITAPPDKPNDVTDRVTYQLAVHHERVNQKPTVHEVFASRPLQTQGQSLQRTLKVESKPTTLEKYWVESPGCVIIENITGFDQSTVLSKDEKAELDSTIVRAVIAPIKGRSNIKWSNSIIIRPKMFSVFEIGSDSKVVVKAENNAADIQYTIIPR